MAPQLVGHRLKHFIDGRGFDLEELLGLSLMDFKRFLKDPEFGVDNVQILFLLRDWKTAKEDLTSAPLVSDLSDFGSEEIQNSVPAIRIKQFGENSDRGFITDLETTLDGEKRPKPAPSRTFNSSATIRRQRFRY
jgi:hypothetical protein